MDEKQRKAQLVPGPCMTGPIRPLPPPSWRRAAGLLRLVAAPTAGNSPPSIGAIRSSIALSLWPSWGRSWAPWPISRDQKTLSRDLYLIGVVGTALLYFVKTGDWLWLRCSLSSASSALPANVFYDSLLPHIARPEEIDQVSSRGYAMGYLGGGILLAVNLAMIMLAPSGTAGFDDTPVFLHGCCLVVRVHHPSAAESQRAGAPHPAAKWAAAR